MNIIVGLLYIILIIFVFTDMTKGIIPNRLILAGCILGILTGTHIREQIPIVIMAALFFFPFFSFGVLGAGDVKCFIMIAFYLESNQFMISILFAFFIAALISFCILLKDIIFNKSKALKQKHTIHLAGPIFWGVLISTGGTYL